MLKVILQNISTERISRQATFTQSKKLGHRPVDELSYIFMEPESNSFKRTARRKNTNRCRMRPCRRSAEMLIVLGGKTDSCIAINLNNSIYTT